MSFRHHGAPPLTPPCFLPSDLAPEAFTFEAWVRTSDNCHRSGIFSYAAPLEDPDGADDAERTRAANHLTIFDADAVLACHDFEFL